MGIPCHATWYFLVVITYIDGGIMKTLLGFAVGFGVICIVASILEKFDKHYSLDFEFDPDCWGDMPFMGGKNERD